MQTLMEPIRFVNAWRFLNIGVLVHLWIIGESATSTFILILLLLVMTSLRWRFKLQAWTVLMDTSICVMYFPYSDISFYGLALPMFELALKGKWLISLLFFVGLFVSPPSSSFLFWNLLQAFFFGAFSFMTINNQQAYKLEVDEQRKAKNELERIKMDLLKANQSISHQAEIMERYRISRELHDHLGHDLTGASLALKAYTYVLDRKEAEQLLEEVKNRLERSTKNLRETVHNMTPTTPIGIESLENIVRNFGQLDVQFHKSGDMLLVPVHHWRLLEVCLKEGLTNAARHSDATKVEVDLHVTDQIVRLSVKDDGTVKVNSQTGSGLRSLQLRARSLGGSLSILRDHGFLLVCVIPLKRVGVDP